ncbi:MAG: hypothetical protein QW650_00175 [Thermofilum sp.]
MSLKIWGKGGEDMDKKTNWEIDIEALQEMFEAIGDISKGMARFIDGAKRVKKAKNAQAKAEKDEEKTEKDEKE